MNTQAEASPAAIPERLQHAMNQHDIEAFLSCFDPDYQSEQPAHPNRGFGGRDQVRKNWSSIFHSIPDFRGELIRATTDNSTIWSEWDWAGTSADGTPMHMRGVIIMGTQNDQIIWARLYVEPVEEAGAGINEAMRKMTKADE